MNISANNKFRITNMCTSLGCVFLQVLLWSVIHLPSWYWPWCWQLQSSGTAAMVTIQTHAAITYWRLWYHWISGWTTPKQGTGEGNIDMSTVQLVTCHDMFHTSFSGQNHSQEFCESQSISHINFKKLVYSFCFDIFIWRIVFISKY